MATNVITHRKPTVESQTITGFVQIQTVVVFGDSLCDIGTKWKTTIGAVALGTGQMFTSPTGRFSDCRNWTDFMFEEAGGLSLVTKDADTSIAMSNRHRMLSNQSWAFGSDDQSVQNFRYLNYAEGGACGDKPGTTMMSMALGTFENQVDQFKKDCTEWRPQLGNTLFIIWFGANDLYTVGCEAPKMKDVADKIANVQRHRLNEIVRPFGGSPRFLFVDLAKPLTAVRYSSLLETAQNNLVAAVKTSKPGLNKVHPSPDYMQYGKVSGYVDIAQSADLAAKELKALQQVLKDIKNLELGVILFNWELAEIARQNGDRVVKLGKCLTEDSVRALVCGNFRLKEGAAPEQAKFISANTYDLLKKKGQTTHITTIDEVHPSDEMYCLIWKEIYREITNARWTFGKLTGQSSVTPLSKIAENMKKNL